MSKTDVNPCGLDVVENSWTAIGAAAGFRLAGLDLRQILVIAAQVLQKRYPCSGIIESAKLPSTLVERATAQIRIASAGTKLASRSIRVPGEFR